MGLPEKKSATYADLCGLPEHLVGEIVDGELYASPRPALPHALATSNLLSELAGPFRYGGGDGRPPGGWLILVEPELHIVDQTMVPDLAGWRRERMPDVTAASAELAPDWLCEVLSPSTAILDRTKKMPHYLRAGVRHLWLVDPIRQTLEVYKATDVWQSVGTHTGASKVRAEPFDAIELDLALLWAR